MNGNVAIESFLSELHDTAKDKLSGLLKKLGNFKARFNSSIKTMISKLTKEKTDGAQEGFFSKKASKTFSRNDLVSYLLDHGNDICPKWDTSDTRVVRSGQRDELSYIDRFVRDLNQMFKEKVLWENDCGMIQMSLSKTDKKYNPNTPLYSGIADYYGSTNVVTGGYMTVQASKPFDKIVEDRGDGEWKYIGDKPQKATYNFTFISICDLENPEPGSKLAAIPLGEISIG